MLNEQDAIRKLKMVIPDCNPQKIVVYGNLYLILAPRSDPAEGNWDPYFSVDMNTGAAKDYSIYQDGKAREIASLFENAETIGNERR